MSETYRKIQAQISFPTPADWLKIKTIDMHTCGEPLRVIVDGFPPVHGNSILDYRNYVRAHHDHLRKSLMWEPRGHADMYGCILTPPQESDSDFGILFIHNDGYSTMCGHAVIGITTLAIQMGWVAATAPETMVKMDAPCGQITAWARVEDGEVQGVRFHCVPSFAVDVDKTVKVDGLGTVNYDLGYGGAFYAYVDARPLGLELGPENHQELIQKGMAIKHAVMESNPNIKHPFADDLSFLYGTIFIGDPQNEGVDSRNVCIFADGEVDRCPTGSGVSGRMALHHAKGEIKIGETMRIESILDTIFIGSVVEEVEYGPFKAVIPQVEGTAFVTGQHEFLIDPKDDLKGGFFLR
jgi:proline racemase